ncbi:MAG: hypothetical protein K8S18_19365 [Desulfobacula sp.]|nr:hypothetical protein [Desulfobacula sp.]
MEKNTNPNVVFIDDRPNELASMFAQFEAAQINITLLRNSIGVADFIESGKRADVFIVDVI